MITHSRKLSDQVARLVYWNCLHVNKWCLMSFVYNLCDTNFSFLTQVWQKFTKWVWNRISTPLYTTWKHTQLYSTLDRYDEVGHTQTLTWKKIIFFNNYMLEWKYFLLNCNFLFENIIRSFYQMSLIFHLILILNGKEALFEKKKNYF